MRASHFSFYICVLVSGVSAGSWLALGLMPWVFDDHLTCFNSCLNGL